MLHALAAEVSAVEHDGIEDQEQPQGGERAGQDEARPRPVDLVKLFGKKQGREQRDARSADLMYEYWIHTKSPF